jgi:hypothetical protein
LSFNAVGEFFEGLVEQVGGERVDGADIRGMIQVFGECEFLQFWRRRHVWGVCFEEQTINGYVAEHLLLLRFARMSEVA